MTTKVTTMSLHTKCDGLGPVKAAENVCSSAGCIGSSRGDVQRNEMLLPWVGLTETRVTDETGQRGLAFRFLLANISRDLTGRLHLKGLTSVSWAASTSAFSKSLIG